MTCACCETGRCCDGGNCSAGTRSQCATAGGEFTGQATIRGNPCDNKSCNDPTGRSFCDLRDPCACAAAGRVPTEWETCGCHLAGNTCPAYLCSTCNIVNGAGTCVSTCLSPRVCCAGTCCPESQLCAGVSNPTCIDRCAAGTTYCRGLGTSYECCAADEKCCGEDGCLPFAAGNTSVNYTIDLSQNTWVSTGLFVPAGATVQISSNSTFGSSVTRLASQFGEDRKALGAGVSPAGINDTSRCRMYPECDVDAGFCHMRLIGKVGATVFDASDGTLQTPGSGLLQLRQNNICTANDTGSYFGTATCNRTDPCPGFTPASAGEPIVYGAGEKPVAPSPGPGAALKFLLSLAGIVSSPTCSCNARAAQMDSWGGWESLKRTPEICDWLKEEATKRDMWFFRPAGYALVLAAVLLSALKQLLPGNNK